MTSETRWPPQGQSYDGLEVTRYPYKRHLAKMERIAAMANVEASRLRAHHWTTAARAMAAVAQQAAEAAVELEALATTPAGRALLEGEG